MSTWKSPGGKICSMQDKIPVPLPEKEDRWALIRTVDMALTVIDEARGNEPRIVFAERLVRLREQLNTADFSPQREDIHALHALFHIGTGHASNVILQGSDDRPEFIKRLGQIRRAVFDAVFDHDEVPRKERSY